MHELAAAHELVEAACDYARRAGAKRVSRLHCRIGSLRALDERLLSEAFEIARRGTICERAELRIEKPGMTCLCPSCRERFEIREWQWECPRCGTEGVDPMGGDELELVSIEAEVPDEHSSPAECVCQE